MTNRIIDEGLFNMIVSVLLEDAKVKIFQRILTAPKVEDAPKAIAAPKGAEGEKGGENG